MAPAAAGDAVAWGPSPTLRKDYPMAKKGRKRRARKKRKANHGKRPNAS